uniref:Uncharacterized protein n=1 Tax=Strongyloides venezuelensis TaxID=75913 RepID=A0A0K0FPF8_STRVS
MKQSYNKFSGYRETYEDLRRLEEKYKRERREESKEEIVEDHNAVDEEPVAVDDMIMGEFEDEKWDLVSIDGGNENNDGNTALYENADITLKDFISDLMDTKLKSGISDREHELYLSSATPNRLYTTLEGTKNYIKGQKISLSDEALYHDSEDGKLVIYNAKKRIDEIFNLYKKEIIEYTEEMLSSAQIKDTICGNFYKTISEIEKNIFTVGVQMHFDGANFNKSNRTHKIFPISQRILNLPMSIRNKFQFYIPLAIYYGGQKPPTSFDGR